MGTPRIQWSPWPRPQGAPVVHLIPPCGACRGIGHWQRPRDAGMVCHTCHPLWPGILTTAIAARLYEIETNGPTECPSCEETKPDDRRVRFKMECAECKQKHKVPQPSATPRMDPWDPFLEEAEDGTG